jgi:hypothetical protein
MYFMMFMNCEPEAIDPLKNYLQWSHNLPAIISDTLQKLVSLTFFSLR